jgi:hypothetical protein
MAALADDAARLEDDDVVGVPDRRDPLGDDQNARSLASVVTSRAENESSKI